MAALLGDQERQGREEPRREERGEVSVAAEEPALGLEGPAVQIAEGPGDGQGRGRREAPAEGDDQPADPLAVGPGLARQLGDQLDGRGRREARGQPVVDAGQLPLKPEGLAQALQEEAAAVGGDGGGVDLGLVQGGRRARSGSGPAPREPTRP